MSSTIANWVLEHLKHRYNIEISTPFDSPYTIVDIVFSPKLTIHLETPIAEWRIYKSPYRDKTVVDHKPKKRFNKEPKKVNPLAKYVPKEHRLHEKEDGWHNQPTCVYNWNETGIESAFRYIIEHDYDYKRVPKKDPMKIISGHSVIKTLRAYTFSSIQKAQEVTQENTLHIDGCYSYVRKMKNVLLKSENKHVDMIKYAFFKFVDESTVYYYEFLKQLSETEDNHDEKVKELALKLKDMPICYIGKYIKYRSEIRIMLDRGEGQLRPRILNYYGESSETCLLLNKYSGVVLAEKYCFLPDKELPNNK
ncbi:hypothetical protein [Brevibacillus nitrificans]|uniref:hypothetical protein n=1 Tax=Brevibacillus nitrificans TaxID=651560 RepID=UPI00261043D5|nr:hypothetical protein [Brevibacillus nitrificans]